MRRAVLWSTAGAVGMVLLAMLVPLAVLSLGAVFAGFGFHHYFIEAEGGAEFWRGSLVFNEHLMHASHQVPLWVKLTPGIVMLIGLGLAWNNYIRRPDTPAKWVAATGPTSFEESE